MLRVNQYIRIVLFFGLYLGTMALIMAEGAGARAGISSQQFTRITEGPHVNDSSSSSGVCWVDYDGDNDLDLYVSNNPGLTDGDNCLYENQGDGTYIERNDLAITQDATSTYSASWGDLDNDGDLDLVVANFREEASVVYINDGAGSFTATSNGPLSEGPVGATNASWVDYNLDGDLDLFICNSTGPGSEDYPPWVNFLFLNVDGVLTRVQTGDIATRARHSYGASWSDFSNDGYPDLVVPNNTPEATDLYLNNGGDSFSRLSSSIICASSANGGGASWADYDNDGDIDLFLANFHPGPSFLYKNTGVGNFVAVTGHGLGLTNGRALGGVWGDYDNDGDQDIFIWLSAWDINTYECRLFDNLGDGTFAPAESGVLECDSCAAHAAVWGDHDRDGDLDLYITRAELVFPPPTPPRPEYADNMLYQNNGNANHWINIKPIGTVSNRSAIGTKVRVRATIGGIVVWQMRELMTQTGRLVQYPLECHFGLGDATMIDSIKVEWPSGIVDIMTDVEVDQYLEIMETRCGDANGDEQSNVGDAVFIINYVFKGGTAPDPLKAGDANCDGDCNVGDAVYLINFVFKGGPGPCAGC